jgi:hypothetical protein
MIAMHKRLLLYTRIIEMYIPYLNSTYLSIFFTFLVTAFNFSNTTAESVLVV